MATNSSIMVPQNYTTKYSNLVHGWNTSHPTTISKKIIILIYHYLHAVSMGGKPYHPTHKPGSTILNVDTMLLKSSIPAAPRKNGMLRKSRLVGTCSQPNCCAAIIHLQSRKGAKTPDCNWHVRVKHQHCSWLYATTQPGYDTQSGGSPPFHNHHWHFRHVWTATHYTRRCTKNTLLITTRNLC